MGDALKRHWPEYLIEAAALGLFMVSACTFAALLEHPASPIHQAIPHPIVRRALMGAAMGLTAVALIYSPWGRRSGAHMNPSVTLTFYRLGKVEPWDAVFYVLAQFAGGVAGVLLMTRAVPALVSHPSVNYVVTVPGRRGPSVAFVAELAISLGMMAMVLIASNSMSLMRFTGLGAGVLVALYIGVEAPLSGMSMNPARTLASALPARTWTAIWTYFTAPPLGMLLAAELYLRLGRVRGVKCAKLQHHGATRCIFRCGYAPAKETRP